ncbi:oxidoreductase-like domain-containing protein, partial [Cupriavidus sp. CER94]|uniref:oxidoreductase-like domain-containing protein n=1 Tax=Cupriavidus sp. CER94 TaxID=3377036 RepID=UPI0038183EB6
QCLAVSAAESAADSFPPPDDPKPLPPERPGDNECCQSGCDPCVFDFYNDEMDRYRQELKAWEARQVGRVKVDR